MTVNIFVYILYCFLIALSVDMCLKNQQNIRFDSSYKSLMESLNSDITSTLEACEYLEPDNNWPIEIRDLLIMQLNVRGLSSKVDQIKRIIDKNPCNKPPEVILLCETWLNDYSPNINIPGYHLELENRMGKKVEG